MFTGIVEEIGTLKHIKRGRFSAVLTIEASKILTDLHIGDSIAVNGVCLTATSFDDTTFTADAMHETIDRSSLKSIRAGSHLNLERAMQAGGRFGGHIVAGHVDATGRITHIRKDDNAIWYTIAAPPHVMRYIIEKGSITVDGMSLTVAAVSDRDFQFSAIPHTTKVTILGEKKVGDQVNLENDMIGKYVEKLLRSPAEEAGDTVSNTAALPDQKSGLTMEMLQKYGF